MMTTTDTVLMTGETMLYEELVRSLMDAGSDEFISNGQPAHAMVLFKLFFERAQNRVQIFCRNLNNSVFGDDRLLEVAKSAVSRGVTIETIIQETDPKPSNFASWLQETSKTNNHILFASCAPIERFADLPANFAVMDCKAFRFERNRSEIVAVAAMNRPKDANNLAEVFGAIKAVVLGQ